MNLGTVPMNEKSAAVLDGDSEKIPVCVVLNRAFVRKRLYRSER
jgi:hypothetical protein